MSKKVLNIEGIKNELEGASLYFTRSPASQHQQDVSDQEPVQSLPESEIQTQEPVELNIAQEKMSTRKKPKTIANEHAIMHASINAGMPANHQDDLIETIRKTVKQVGKEVLFVRVSPTEKHTLGSIVYSFNEIYRGEGRKTSENEIGRIGLNFLLEDYRENGNNSLLAQVLAALAA
jgi:hypothetical protein